MPAKATSIIPVIFFGCGVVRSGDIEVVVDAVELSAGRVAGLAAGVGGASVDGVTALLMVMAERLGSVLTCSC